MPGLGKIQLGLKALHELGIRSTGWFAIYHLGLFTGHYRRASSSGSDYPNGGFDDLHLPIEHLDKEALARVLGSETKLLLQEANEIVGGKFRAFGGEPVRLNLTPPQPIRHWTEYETGKTNIGVEDIKFTWEPARFSWAFILARAYALTGDEKYSLAFWKYFEQFEKNNPTFYGLNWISGQEVGIRLIGLTFAACAFRDSVYSTPARQQKLVNSLANHTRRINLTLPYAQAQRNNHLLSEAVGLFTAGVLLGKHPDSSGWKKKGWDIFNRAIVDQIDENGVFIQQSMNYHRLMLHNALWFKSVAKSAGMDVPETIVQKLGQSVRWLMAQMDFQTGDVPNLGHNDGSNFLQLACSRYGDCRPVVQAASVAFLDQPAFPKGTWDETCLWLGLKPGKKLVVAKNPIKNNAVFELHQGKLHAFLRVATFYARPAHADQLHVDLWCDHINVAMDTGTYQYNLPAPWNNTLGKTLVHNTVTLDEKDQMTWAGRFLWLDWAQAEIIRTAEPNSITAQHHGYDHLGITHRRQLRMVSAYKIEVIDEMIPVGNKPNEHAFWLHWLLPDLPWKLKENLLLLHLGQSKDEIQVKIDCEINGKSAVANEIQIVREGKNLTGSGIVPVILGWHSLLYGEKKPALSFRVCIRSKESVRFTTQFLFQ